MSAASLNKTLAFLLVPGIFLALVLVFREGLTRNPREVPSPLIGKPAPHFELPQLHAPEKTFSEKDMLGKVWLLNFWASWCASCHTEHPVLLDLAKSQVVPIYGLNYKNERKDAMAWLQRLGDPYQLSAYDSNGRVGIDYGSYGLPETYVIDKRGVIRYKLIGPVTPDIVKLKILPLVHELNRV